MQIAGLTSVAAITVICNLVGMIVKNIKIPNKWIPIICGLLGGALGIVSAHVISNFPANDIITALAVGIVSGLAATGAHQAVTQLKNGNGN